MANTAFYAKGRLELDNISVTPLVVTIDCNYVVWRNGGPSEIIQLDSNGVPVDVLDVGIQDGITAFHNTYIIEDGRGRTRFRAGETIAWFRASTGSALLPFAMVL